MAQKINKKIHSFSQSKDNAFEKIYLKHSSNDFEMFDGSLLKLVNKQNDSCYFQDFEFELSIKSSSQSSGLSLWS